MTKPPMFMVDEDHYVHAWFCKLEFPKEPQPYLTKPKNATELVEWLAQPDRQNQFGSVNEGPSLLRCCQVCIPAMLESERDDA